MGQPGLSPASRRSCVQVPPGPQVSRRGWAKTTLSPSQGVPWFIPSQGTGLLTSPLPRTQAALPLPLPRAAFGEELGPHRHPLTPTDRGRKSGKRTEFPLPMGRGLLSYLAPTPRCSASVPSLWAGTARLRSKNSGVPGRGWAGSLRPASFMLILFTEARLQPPGPALGPRQLSSGSLLLL